MYKRSLLFFVVCIAAAACSDDKETKPKNNATPDMSADAASDLSPDLSADDMPDAAPDAGPQCEPSAELCNGVDDDCDGYIDEDCPDVSKPLTFGGAESWMPKRGGGGMQQHASCGSIGVVGGVHVWAHDVVDRIQLQCYSLKLQARMVGDEFVYDVMRDVQTDMPDPHIGNPNNGSRASETNCRGNGGPPNGSVTGINTIWGSLVDQLQVECSQGVLKRNSSGQWELQLTYTNTPDPTFRYPTNIPNQVVDRCPANTAVTGINVWWGENIDAVQFRCNAASWSMTDRH